MLSSSERAEFSGCSDLKVTSMVSPEMVSPEAFVKRDIVVVGASAGGVPALEVLVRGLAEDFQGAMLVVLHIPPWAPSKLAAILSRRGPLPAYEVGARERLEAGRIYVAAPDHHLVLDDHHIAPWKGPAEDRHRPSINTLFRSAAVTFGARVIGVVLTGTLNDGTAGLWWVKKFGGITVIQDPEEAEFPAMPRSALAHVEIDYVLGLSEMGSFLSELVNSNDGRPASLESQAALERRKWK
jgi:two-component system, chemotaxis family, protein-glutamate methylesterase/glutaminase